MKRYLIILLALLCCGCSDTITPNDEIGRLKERVRELEYKNEAFNNIEVKVSKIILEALIGVQEYADERFNRLEEHLSIEYIPESIQEPYYKEI